ncbi:MAG: hypothetical protein GWP14_08575 [Actinobacteria bacterium]|nr:hypothetical protein [Actinomycetota bacterium]
MSLSKEQIERYSRQMAIKQIGKAGQKKLLDGRVLIIGVGGLGSAAGLYLGAAGVGTIGIVDGDKVELSNLNRQVLHGTVPSSAEAGILGTVPAVVGALQANEAIKFILRIGELLINKMLIYEGLTGAFRQVSVDRDPDCCLCGSNPSINRERER